MPEKSNHKSVSETNVDLSPHPLKIPLMPMEMLPPILLFFSWRPMGVFKAGRLLDAYQSPLLLFIRKPSEKCQFPLRDPVLCPISCHIHHQAQRGEPRGSWARTPWLKNATPPARAALLLGEQPAWEMLCHVAGLGASPEKHHQKQQPLVVPAPGVSEGLSLWLFVPTKRRVIGGFVCTLCLGVSWSLECTALRY